MIEGIYRTYFDSVDAAVGRILVGADRETVIHEVFFSLMTDAKMRQSFRGGHFAGWLRTVSRHRAIDWLRKYRREDALTESHLEQRQAHQAAEGQAELRRVVDYVRARIPEEWVAVFETRFIEQLSQRQAAARLNLHRTTLAYRELRIRRVLRRYAAEPQGDGHA